MLMYIAEYPYSSYNLYSKGQNLAQTTVQTNFAVLLLESAVT
jgi:hypothetical protein